jgi:RNA polymerase sigma-70 factor, ECF subfamily
MEEATRTKFEQLFEAHHAEIFRFAVLKSGSKEVAEDVTAQAFLKYWERLSQGTTIDHPRALLYVIVRGLLIDTYRKADKERHVKWDDVVDGMLHVGPDTDILDQARTYAEVLFKLDLLKPEYKEIIMLHYVQDLPISDIAILLEKSQNNVRVLLHRALSKLRDHFPYDP